MRQPIDVHVHMWERGRHAQDWIDPDSMSAIARDFPPSAAATELATHGVAGCVVVQCVNQVAETVDLLADTAAMPSVLGVVGWLDLTGDVPAQVDDLRARPGGEGLVGVRHVTFAEDDPDWLGRDDVGRGLAALGRADLTYDLLIAHHQLPLAAAVARRHEGTSFVLDHLGKVPMTSADLDTWGRDLGTLASCPNVSVKVSGIVTEADRTRWSTAQLRPVFDHALATFGADRTMFGSDWPLVVLAGGYGRWLEAYLELSGDLSTSEQARIDAANATRIYGLP